MVELHPWMVLPGCLAAHGVLDAVESMMDPLTSLLALSVLLLVVHILGGSVLTWGVIRARMWQGAYPWWDLKPKAHLRYVLLHVLYFFIGAAIYTIWGLVITARQTGRPASFTIANFVLTWIGAVCIGALLMVPPRAIAYIQHVVEQRNRPGPIQSSIVPPAPNPPPIAPLDSGNAGGLPQ